jgi:ribose transport system permease protein
MAMTVRSMGVTAILPTVLLAIVLSFGIGLACGLANGIMIVGLRVHPFIITLGTMWVFRGIAFVTSRAESILVPDSLTAVAKNSLGLSADVYPVPLLAMLALTILGELYLIKTVMGRNIYAVGGNAEAARYCGLRIDRTLVGVYAISGLTAGIAAFIGSSFYGSASCADATGYELYVIAAAVVGGASLQGGKGSAVSAALGAVLIVLIRQSIRTLHFDQNYEWIIIGCAIVVAVVLDRMNAQLAARRMARAAGDRAPTAPTTEDQV